MIPYRFFFISDDELLSVLGTSDPSSVQEHMLKLFDNCAALNFGRNNKSVQGMTSSEVGGVPTATSQPLAWPWESTHASGCRASVHKGSHSAGGDF